MVCCYLIFRHVERCGHNDAFGSISTRSTEGLPFSVLISFFSFPFSGHDLNRDGLLDGLEIFKSLEHAVDHMPDARQLHQDPAAALERVTGEMNYLS